MTTVFSRLVADLPKPAGPWAEGSYNYINDLDGFIEPSNDKINDIQKIFYPLPAPRPSEMNLESMPDLNRFERLPNCSYSRLEAQQSVIFLPVKIKESSILVVVNCSHMT
jgi:hypothetical protein